jgi:hypothetical protein
VAEKFYPKPRKPTAMIKLLILPIYLFFFHNPGETYFKVDTVNEVNSWMKSLIPDNEPPYYKIRFSGDESELGMIVYPPYSENEFSNTDIEKMIAELLTYKDDTRKCFLKIKCSGDAAYNGSLTHYSLQVEALYIINSLFFDSYTNYSPCPILTDEAGNIAALDGEIITNAFDAYEKWFIEIKAMGIGNARAAAIDPLKDSGVKWFE